jgi:serine/threonine protein kinase
LSIAQPLRALVGKLSPIGTDAYMAPEQCDPALRGPITAAADVWGVGATLYDASSGRQPFERPSPDDPRFPQLEEAPAHLPEKLPQEFRELVTACLDPDPGARPTPAEAAGELELLVDALPRRLVLGRFRVRTR